MCKNCKNDKNKKIRKARADEKRGGGELVFVYLSKGGLKLLDEELGKKKKDKDGKWKRQIKADWNKILKNIACLLYYINLPFLCTCKNKPACSTCVFNGGHFVSMSEMDGEISAVTWQMLWASSLLVREMDRFGPWHITLLPLSMSRSYIHSWMPSTKFQYSTFGSCIHFKIILTFQIYAVVSIVTSTDIY